MPKIVVTDNFDRSGETPGCDEEFIADASNPYWADKIVKALIDKHCGHPDATQYFKVVPDDYKLRVFSP